MLFVWASLMSSCPCDIKETPSEPQAGDEVTRLHVTRHVGNSAPFPHFISREDRGQTPDTHSTINNSNVKQVVQPCAWPQSPSLCVGAAAPLLPLLASQETPTRTASAPTQASWLQGALLSGTPMDLLEGWRGYINTGDSKSAISRVKGKSCVGKVHFLKWAATTRRFSHYLTQLACFYSSRMCHWNVCVRNVFFLEVATSFICKQQIEQWKRGSDVTNPWDVHNRLSIHCRSRI